MIDEIREHLQSEKGYGSTGNVSLNMVLNTFSPSERKEYEEELLLKDKEAFLEFKEWQKVHNALKKKSLKK